MCTTSKQKKTEKRKKDALQIQKNMHKESLAVRAGSVRPRGLVGISKSMHINLTQSLLPGCFHCCRRVQTAAPRPTKPKEKGKKNKKEASEGQKPRLSRSAGFRRPECEGGVCQPEGWLGCTLFAGCGLNGFGGSLVCILFARRTAGRCPPSVCTFCRIVSG